MKDDQMTNFDEGKQYSGYDPNYGYNLNGQTQQDSMYASGSDDSAYQSSYSLNTSSQGTYSMNTADTMNNYGGQPYDMAADVDARMNYGQMMSGAPKAKARSNVVTGIIGALLGSLVGVALWVGIYKLGYIAGIAGAIMIVSAMFGYEKLGGSLDLKGIIISAVICIGMIYISERICISMQLYEEFKDYKYYFGDVSFFDCYKSMFTILKDVEKESVFWGELGIGYLLFAIASVSYIVKSVKMRNA